MPKDKLIGKITHYFNNVGVAVVNLNGTLAVGDTIQIKGGERDFEQVAASIQIEHEIRQKAKAGEAIGLKVAQAVREGDSVYKK
ncbi:MAG: hypothetical protein COS76_02745 [Candidatus Portnoybacteria bacterium CG06_land_8_20_14_3_00_39_12]|uniref:Translation elongation factor-like protein n=2 Tax=Candidatus Portnoyibacteriota TaxID=1817913 RepID=A0A2M7UJQ4_9BACT|nr:MAG: hypothetical protein AUJ33_00200 [Parcubacteria group bacterium CG1_02_40_25]PIU75076.1 MAG: hypothetical protein COS76_02745 [Candidatus Portnoybacteria bacterium CG06_land_8_20_14_3_00_39_12]PIZ71474.1 MAG: hypothetical protein COY09_00595 [Candidatus Portnoybacteria bacterium CG_4_10_14_0_2_um_filter_39_11]